MRNLLPILAFAGPALAGIAAPLLSQTTPATRESCLHTQTSFDLLVHASYAITVPLFGPNGERAWAGKHWDPQFIHPQPASDADGAVFTIQHGPHTATWVTTLFDVDARHFQYVYFLPDLMVTVIDVRFKPVNADSTAVKVTYTRTALTLEGNPHVTTMSEGDKTAGKEWQQAIDEYLAQSKSSLKP
ncbi:MAG: hypothetical protein WBQ94_04960 [Terracidiphilus sp.]